MSPLRWDLRVLLAVRHEKGHADLFDHAIQMHAFGNAQEVILILRTPDPAHVLPVVRHRKAAFTRKPLELHVAPIMVGAPHHAAGKARLEGNSARTEIAA